LPLLCRGITHLLSLKFIVDAQHLPMSWMHVAHDKKD
jgi:hypothetical protein